MGGDTHFFDIFLAYCFFVCRNLGKEIFSQTPLVGAGKLVTAHAYYSTETLEKILLAVFGMKICSCWVWLFFHLFNNV